MSTFKAIKIVEGNTAAILDIPQPELREGWILVKTKAVAINPTDCKAIQTGRSEPGCRSGCDFAGIVEQVGANVTTLKKGDRVAGILQGANNLNHDLGTFGEYLIAKAALTIKVPDNVSLEGAATLGVSIATVAQGLYMRLKLPLPDNPTKEPFPILIHGGSTATGMYGIQFAKASGLTVITTASPHNFDLVKSLGADAVFDYKSPTAGKDINTYTSDKLKHVWDCIGSGSEICATALSSSGGEYANIMPVDKDTIHKINPNIDGPKFHLAYDVFHEEYTWFGKTIPVKPDEFEFATKFFALTAELLAKEVIKPIRIEVNKGGDGLEGVLKGIEELSSGRVSGTKLVYQV